MKLAPYIKHSLLHRTVDTPLTLILLVTSRCNARCTHCFFADELNQTPDIMTLENYECLSRELTELCQLYLGGGEPFLRKGLVEICRVFDRNNHVSNVTIPTNGLLVDRIAAVVEEILDTCSFDLMISLSLDGTRQCHDAIRGVKGGFDKLLQTYARLVRLQAKCSSFRIQATTTIMRDNVKDLPRLIDWVKGNMPGISAHNFELVRGGPSEYCDMLPPLEELQSFGRVHRRMVLANDRYLPESRVKSWLAKRMKANLFDECLQVLDTERQVFDCVGGVGMGVVDYKGDVLLCELLPPVGNVLEDGFRAAWCSPKAERLRRAIRAKKCHCTHSCFQANSNLMHPKAYLKMLR
ncbi:MAG: radical SAM protein [Phycisphaerae bacterium]|nr:radical SAM protein [Phycisphaerae bacterium]